MQTECACGKPGWYEHHDHTVGCRRLVTPIEVKVQKPKS